MPTPTQRLSKELLKMNNGGLPPGITIHKSDNFESWEMDIKVLDANPLYKNQTFRLKFVFGNRYPMEPPEVIFLRLPDRPVPLHPHIYTNGYICLDILSPQGWSPVQSVQTVCVSIQSMLTGNSIAQRPEGNDEFVRTNTLRPRDVNYIFHDDTV